MKVLLLILASISFLAFQNCSENTFSDVGSAQSKVGGEQLEVGPDVDEVAEEDREDVHEYFRCGYDDDSESSDDGSSDSSDDDRNIKVALCHNGHVICISENALFAHLVVHVNQQGDEHVDNYGACHDDDDSESSDDEDSADSDDESTL